MGWGSWGPPGSVGAPQQRCGPCSFTLELHKHVSKDSGFWGDAGDTIEDTGPQSQVLVLPVAKITAPRQEAGQQQVTRDISATEMRLVHLDLKGAAPRVSYLEQVRCWGWEGRAGRDVPRGLSTRNEPTLPNAGVPAPVPAGSQRRPH